MEIQYIGYVISSIVWIYMNRGKILDFSIHNRIGKWTIGLIMAPISVPIAIYKILYWEKHDPMFRKIMEKVIFQKKITDFVT